MAVNTNKIWFHADEIIAGKTQVIYNGNQPAFFNENNYDWCDLLSANYTVFLKEFLLYSNANKLNPYFYKAQAGETEKWKTLPLITWNIKRKYLNHFVETGNILDRIPGLVSASFSMLEAGGEILQHNGDTDAHIRTHLCLFTAVEKNKLKFTVRNEIKSWETGKCLLFCDAYLHNGYNYSNENRLVMIIDVLHAPHIKYTEKICAKVLAGLFINYIFVLFKLKTIEKYMRPFVKFIYLLFQFVFRMFMRFKIKL